jgi:hypothetical protein
VDDGSNQCHCTRFLNVPSLICGPRATSRIGPRVSTTDDCGSSPMSTPAAHRQRRPEAVLHPGAPTETRFTSACNDGCCGEGVGGHRTVQPPGDRDGTFAVVFDVQRLTSHRNRAAPSSWHGVSGRRGIRRRLPQLPRSRARRSGPAYYGSNADRAESHPAEVGVAIVLGAGSAGRYGPR